ncbi:MAG: glycosyltransferase family 2 protein [Planctomycetota bacterium]|nr:glycosyltransferase family 2 protein [Planctomycetota bacterium]
MTQARPLPDLAVALTTGDSMRTIERTLRSLEGLARRIVVVDSGSTDGTIECCRRFGAEVLHREWDGPTSQKQFSIDQCRDHRWVLLLDSDETIEDELRQSMLDVMKADDPACDGWWLNRRVWFLGGWLHHTFQPEWRLRLFRGGRGRVVGIGPHGRGGHDRVVVDGRTGRLRGFCGHDSWADLEALCRRNIELARRAADYYPRGGTPFHIVFSPPAAMIKQYVLKRGFLDGRRGLIAAGAVAGGTLLKHLFIARRRLAPARTESGADER